MKLFYLWPQVIDNISTLVQALCDPRSKLKHLTATQNHVMCWSNNEIWNITNRIPSWERKRVRDAVNETAT